MGLAATRSEGSRIARAVAALTLTQARDTAASAFQNCPFRVEGLCSTTAGKPVKYSATPATA